jgi:pimeloyl-ACP methyl ester carboxylesterase
MGESMTVRLLAGRPIAALSIAVLLGLSAAPAAGQIPTAKNDYAKPEAWLCWPGKAGDACAVDLTTTVIKADGTETVEAFKADPKAPIDCFYVYPTVSNDPGVVSDMVPGPEELNVVRQQVARLGAKCRIYAPMYRQVTLTALRAGIGGKPLPGAADPAARTLGYNDVVDAWTYYLAHENKGRGVVLVGHSQGSGVLTRMIAAEVDGKPAQKQLVSAILMGTSLALEPGKDTGAFKTIPTCKSANQLGCVIAYATFRDTVPPPANSRFGRTPMNPGMEAACVNPAAPGGGKGELKAYLSNTAQIADAGPATTVWVSGKPNPKTPFVAVPGLLTGQCVAKNGFNYLEAHVNADPADPRTDDIPGDVKLPNGQVLPDWGLHLIDANIAMGNLLDVVGQQAKAWAAKK